jgi:hypothetical protein
MSTDYRTEKRILVADLFDGRLEEFNVRVHIHKHGTKDFRCLSDGENYLSVYGSPSGFISCLSRNGGDNYVSHILSSIAEAFDTTIYSEHECQYWGFASDDELNAWRMKIETRIAGSSTSD